MKLPTQVWSSRNGRPLAKRLLPVTVRVEHPKPAGGLWTSTLKDGGSEWIEWCEFEEFGEYTSYWLLEPERCAVLVIDGPAELQAAHERFPFTMPEELRGLYFRIDWPAVAEVYDAVHVPNPQAYRWWDMGLPMQLEQEEWRRAMSISMFFGMLDVESTIWFRWKFDQVKERR